MAKGVRVPERAFGIAMWVVSIILAAFIVGLGNLVIGDLPQVEKQISQDQFVQSAPAQKIRTELAAIAAGPEDMRAPSASQQRAARWRGHLLIAFIVQCNFKVRAWNFVK